MTMRHHPKGQPGSDNGVYQKRRKRSPTTSAEENDTPTTSSAEQEETTISVPDKREINRKAGLQKTREDWDAERKAKDMEESKKNRVDFEYLALDVECAATGRGHDDLSPCRISLVNGQYQVLLDVVINTQNLYSPLTPLTGLTREQIRQGIPLEEGLQQLHSMLHDKVVLVGQLIEQDCTWCKLVQGVHYRHVVDLSELMKIWQNRLRRYLYFSLDRAAFGLLGITSEYPHSPVRDATMSMRIFNEWCQNAEQLKLAREVLQNACDLKLFPKRRKPVLDDDVCTGKFNRSKCTCHQKQTCY